jgi:peptidoglycan hydrolase-like protein with peptidoglycan-binding domain
MSRRIVAVAVATTALAGGAWGVGSAYADHRSELEDARPSAAEPAEGPQPLGVEPAAAPTAAPTPRPTEPAQRPAPRRTPAPQVTLEPTPEPAPVLLAPGDEGPEVREMQARLRQIFWLSGDVTDYYGDTSRAAIAGFQTKRGLPSTGSLDTVTLERLEAMTTEPTSDELANIEPEPVVTADGATLDPRCETGRVLCIDKSTNSLRWVVDGDVQLTLDARFGGNGYTTREGQFAVNAKSRDHVSSIYDTSMPFAMFFSGGQAVHYSPDFAATGYAGASHGCVNIRDYDAIAGLYDEVQIGDTVVVYWS